MKQSEWQYRPRSVDLMWAWGGRILDLSGDQLDYLAARIGEMRGRPWDIKRAQQQIDAYTERFRVEREATA